MSDYDILADEEKINKVVEGLAGRGVEGIVVNNRLEALEKIKSLITAGASVMNGSSRTLEEIGYIEYLRGGQHGWNNLHQAVLAEKDPTKQAILRKQSVISDYYLGSVHAITEDGEMVIASNSGSQLPHIVFTSPNIIFVVSTKKIVPTLAEAMKRLEDHVASLEDKNIMSKFNVHTMLSKIVIFRRENPRMGRKVRMILVKENLGF